MNRRTFIKQSVALSLSLSAGKILAQGAAGANRNILVILVDEMRDLSWIPESVRAQYLPNLNQLMNLSAVFPKHFSAATQCSPARASLVTGTYTHQNYILSNTTLPVDVGLNPGFPTYGSELRKLGYDSWWFGKWHLSFMTATCSPVGLEPYGFSGSMCLDPDGRPNSGVEEDSKITEKFTNWLALRAKTGNRKPWNATVSLVNPHDIAYFWGQSNCLKNAAVIPPYWMTPEFFANQGMMPCANFEDPFNPSSPKPTLQSYYASLNHNQNGVISYDPKTRGASTSGLCGRIGAERGAVAPFDYWYQLLQYYMYLHVQVDKQIGVILEALKSSPYFKDTVVVFTSDHGDYTGAHGLRGKGGALYDEGYQVPFYVYDPAATLVTTPGIRKGMSSSVDLMPLLISIGKNAPVRSWAPGTSLSYLAGRCDLFSQLKDPSLNGRSSVLFTSDSSFNVPDNIAYHAVALRTEEGKLGSYTVWPRDGIVPDLTREEREVYDYRDGDRREVNNVAESSDLTEKLHAMLHGSGTNPGLYHTELRAPLSAALKGVQAQALRDYLRYIKNGSLQF